MNALLPLLISLLGKLIPAIAGNADLITEIVTSLQQIVPILVKEYSDVAPLVQNIITALKGTDGITADQWAALDALEKVIDAEFDAAASDEGFPKDPTQG